MDYDANLMVLCIEGRVETMETNVFDEWSKTRPLLETWAIKRMKAL